MERDLRGREHQAMLQMMERLARQQNEEHEALLTHVSAGLKELTRLVTEGEASCFYHPNKKAVLPCEACGRFLCALCDVELNGQHLCPACLASGQKKGKLSNLDNRRVLYDSLALTLALLPLLVWPFTLITAPAALFIAIRYWRAPGSLVQRTKIRLILAMFFALAQMAGWGIGFWAMFNS